MRPPVLQLRTQSTVTAGRGRWVEVALLLLLPRRGWRQHHRLRARVLVLVLLLLLVVRVAGKPATELRGVLMAKTKEEEEEEEGVRVCAEEKARCPRRTRSEERGVQGA